MARGGGLHRRLAKHAEQEDHVLAITEDDMLMELSIIPLGRGRSISADLADAIELVDESGLDYKVTPTSTVVEGEWDELVDVARRCHGSVREKSDRVITLIKLDDHAERTGRLSGAVESVVDKVERPLRT